MQKNDAISLWISLSKALFNDLLPKGVVFKLGGTGMKKSEFAFLVHRETKRVNAALMSMSFAVDENEVHAIVDALSKDTAIVLFSRWSHLLGELRKLEIDEHFPLWFHPRQKDLWRAIFLSMMDDIPTATAACKALWPGLFQE